MQPIRVYSPSFELLAEIDNYESLQFNRYWSGAGQFELHINKYKKFTETLQKKNIIVLGNQLNKCGIIWHREISVDSGGKNSEQWVIQGFQLKAVVGQRITIPPSGQGYDYKSGPAETVIKHYIDANCVNPTDANRKISQLVLATDQGRGGHFDWQSRYEQLLDDVLVNISENDGIGWEVSLDPINQRWLMDCYVGRDLSASQSINPPVIFSPDFESIKTQHMVDDELNLKNYAIVGGQGEDAARQIVNVGTATGLDRRETFVDARDVDDTSSVTLTQRGQQALDDAAQQLYLEGDVLAQSPFVYERDWDLGDIVTVRNGSWGVTVDERITAVQETFEPAGKSLSVTFGLKVPTVIELIKGKFRWYDRELKR